MNEVPFPADWNKWREQWDTYNIQGTPVHPSKVKDRFPGKNFMADEILGYWQVGDHIVELSEGTGIHRERFIGVTVDAAGSGEGFLVWSFAELDKELARLAQGNEEES